MSSDNQTDKPPNPEAAANLRAAGDLSGRARQQVLDNAVAQNSARR